MILGILQVSILDLVGDIGITIGDTRTTIITIGAGAIIIGEVPIMLIVLGIVDTGMAIGTAIITVAVDITTTIGRTITLTTIMDTEVRLEAMGTALRHDYLNQTTAFQQIL